MQDSRFDMGQGENHRQERAFSQRVASLVWRSLSAYGRIKYRYLLPAYAMLGLDNKKNNSTPPLALRGAQRLARLLNGSGDHRDQLQAVIERTESARGAVIFLPSTGWEIANPQRSHHLAREFARLGFVSVFDSTNAYDDVDGFREIEPNLFLFRGPAPLLAEIPDAVLWALTYNFDRRSAYPQNARVVYDWIDDFEVFLYDRAFLERNHAHALKDATLVTCVAQTLHEQASLIRPDALYLPNAVECARFADLSAPIPDDPAIESLRREAKPIACYYGAMAEWLDYELIEAAAREREDWNFLFIGPAYDNSLRERGRGMLKRKNVRWIGPRPYSSLPGYLRLIDVAMIPFLINDITRATSPLKLYEFFAAAKPVVTTPLRECLAFEDVLTAEGAKEFSRALDTARASAQDSAFRERLRKLAEANSWTARAQRVIEKLDV
ncbi:MAG: glycosyltransferase [Acidobacteriota bacterium]